MDSRYNELDDEEIATLNGLCVMNVLAFAKNGITENDLLTFFITSADEPHDIVEREIKRILELGVANGFIERDGHKYALPSLADLNYDADCDDRGEGDKPDKKSKKNATSEEDNVVIVSSDEEDDTENPVGPTFSLRIIERPKAKARIGIQLVSRTADINLGGKCAPSTSAAAGDDLHMKLNYGFTELKPQKRAAESSTTCGDAKKLKPANFKESEAIEEDEDKSDDEDETPSLRRSKRKTKKPKKYDDCFK